MAPTAIVKVLGQESIVRRDGKGSPSGVRKRRSHIVIVVRFQDPSWKSTRSTLDFHHFGMQRKSRQHEGITDPTRNAHDHGGLARAFDGEHTDAGAPGDQQHYPSQEQSAEDIQPDLHALAPTYTVKKRQ